MNNIGNGLHEALYTAIVLKTCTNVPPFSTVVGPRIAMGCLFMHHNFGAWWSKWCGIEVKISKDTVGFDAPDPDGLCQLLWCQ
eukprot:15366086-Ditylum_brightwellii.AAC.1